MPAHRKISDLQMEILISYMEEHPTLAKGSFLDSAQAKAAVKLEWEELAARLNAVMGAEKTPGAWRDYWRDIKYRVKKKAGEIEVHRRGTGGGPPSNVVLTHWEERAYAIIGKKAVVGDESVRIPYDDEELTPALPTSPLPVPASPAASPSSALINVDVRPPSPPASPQPSTSRAPPVGGPPAKRKHRAGARAAAGADAPETTTPATEVVISPPRRRRATTHQPANPSEIPQPRWAWDAEQRRLALDRQRLEVEQGMLATLNTISDTMQQMARSVQELNHNLVHAVLHFRQSENN